MGKIKRGILGGFSGKVANVVGGSWKGVAYMRSQPLSVANPNTAGQQAQRGAMSSIVTVSKVLLVDVLKPLNDRFAQFMSGYNRHVKMSIGAFGTTGLTNPTAFKIAEGSLSLDDIASCGGTSASASVSMFWTSTAGSGSAVANDEAYVVAMNMNSGEVKFKAGSELSRSDEGTTITFDEAPAEDDVVFFWLAFRRADGTIVSNTANKSAVITA